MARSLALLAVLALGPVAAQPMSTDARPAAGTLSPGASAESARFPVRAVSEITEDGCTGFVGPSAPDVVVVWGGGDLRLWSRSSFDATLAVYTPGGDWLCDDDTDGNQPVVDVAGAAPGRYAVWLGSFVPDPYDTDATLWAGPPPPPPVLDASARPLAGTISVQGGFEERQGMIEATVQAGGSDSAEDIDLSNTPDPPDFCTGTLDAGQPSAAVAYDADGGTGALVIGAYAEEDLTMLVQTPGGQILCNDDFDGVNPGVVVRGPQSGRYVVWVGTFASAPDPVTATLLVAETEPEMEDDFEDEMIDEPFGGVPFSEGTYTPLDLATRPATRLAASASEGASAGVTFQPEAFTPVQGPSCAGFVAATATAEVTLSGDGPFALTATSDSDLTLTVRTPSGGWFCSDDADGLNPGVQIDVPEAGRYLVWVGSFGESEGEVSATVSAQPGEIVVSDADFDDPSRGPGQSEGVYEGSAIRPGGAASTRALASDDADEIEVMAGGEILNPVQGEVCHGFLSERPTLEVDGPLFLAISASGDEDLVLVVRAPDGSWTCSDDAFGSAPSIEAASRAPGTYSIWVGTYYRRGRVPATVEVSAPPPPPAPVIRG